MTNRLPSCAPCALNPLLCSLLCLLTSFVPHLNAGKPPSDFALQMVPARSPSDPQDTDRNAALRAISEAGTRAQGEELEAMAVLLDEEGSSQAPAVGEPGETYFLDRSTTMNGNNAYLTHEFTLGARRTLVFRIATAFSSDSGIFTPANAKTFTSGGATTGWAIFNSKFGTQTVTLDAGTYVLAVRNRSSGQNAVRYELDYDLTVPGKRYSHGQTQADNVNANSRYWLPFTLSAGQYLWVDGVNLDLDFFVIADSQLGNFRAGQTFTYFSAFEPIQSANQPGGFHINLAPGSYHLAFRNTTAASKPVTYTLEYWVDQPAVLPPSIPPAAGAGDPSGGGGGGAPSGWFILCLGALTLARRQLRGLAARNSASHW